VLKWLRIEDRTVGPVVAWDGRLGAVEVQNLQLISET
jgi:hypothetical protein